MVQDKLNAFIKQFDFLFMNKECPIIINTFGITDDTNIIKGIVLFIIEQYAKDKESKVQRLEVHEYVSELLVESFYEKLNRLGTDDLITTEFYKIGVKLDNNTNYSVREIIHQIFSRVTFYKHCLLYTSGYVMRHEDYHQAPIANIYIQIARWCNQQAFYKKMSFWEFCYRNQSYWEEHSGILNRPKQKSYKEFEEDINIGYYDSVKMCLPLVSIKNILAMFPSKKDELLEMFNYKMEKLISPSLWEHQ